MPLMSDIFILNLNEDIHSVKRFSYTRTHIQKCVVLIHRLSRTQQIYSLTIVKSSFRSRQIYTLIVIEIQFFHADILRDRSQIF